MSFPDPVMPAISAPDKSLAELINRIECPIDMLEFRDPCSFFPCMHKVDITFIIEKCGKEIAAHFTCPLCSSSVKKWSADGIMQKLVNCISLLNTQGNLISRLASIDYERLRKEGELNDEEELKAGTFIPPPASKPHIIEPEAAKKEEELKERPFPGPRGEFIHKSGGWIPSGSDRCNREMTFDKKRAQDGYISSFCLRGYDDNTIGLSIFFKDKPEVAKYFAEAGIKTMSKGEISCGFCMFSTHEDIKKVFKVLMGHHTMPSTHIEQMKLVVETGRADGRPSALVSVPKTVTATATSTPEPKSLLSELESSLTCPLSHRPLTKAVTCYPCMHKINEEIAIARFGPMSADSFKARSPCKCGSKVESYHIDHTYREIVKLCLTLGQQPRKA